MSVVRDRYSLFRAWLGSPMELAVALIFVVTGARFGHLAFTWEDRLTMGTITALPITYAIAWSVTISLSGLLWTLALSLPVTRPIRQPLERAALILGGCAWGSFGVVTFWMTPEAYWSWGWIAILGTVGLGGRYLKLLHVERGFKRAGGAE